MGTHYLLWMCVGVVYKGGRGIAAIIFFRFQLLDLFQRDGTE